MTRAMKSPTTRRLSGATTPLVRALHLLIAALLWLSAAPLAYAGDARIRVVSAEQLIELALAHPQMVIIDSRLPTDRAHGYIEGSINLSDADTDCASLAGLVPSKSTPVAFYCNGPKCNRSAIASEIAASCGYRESYWLHGGFEEWLDKGYPTLTD